jgi:hypothetical protein
MSSAFMLRHIMNTCITTEYLSINWNMNLVFNNLIQETDSILRYSGARRRDFYVCIPKFRRNMPR